MKANLFHRHVAVAPSKESNRYASVPMHTHQSKKKEGAQDYQVNHNYKHSILSTNFRLVVSFFKASAPFDEFPDFSFLKILFGY